MMESYANIFRIQNELFTPFRPPFRIVSRGHHSNVHRKRRRRPGQVLRDVIMRRLPLESRGATSFWVDPRTGPFWKHHFCIVINEHSLCLDFGAIAPYNIFIMNYVRRGFPATHSRSHGT